MSVTPHPFIDVNGLSWEEVCQGVPIKVVIGAASHADTGWLSGRRPHLEILGPRDGHPLRDAHDGRYPQVVILPAPENE